MRVPGSNHPRFAVFLVFGAALVLALIGRLVYVSAVLRRESSDQAVELPKVERGPILDRNGRILAITTTLDSVSAWVPHVREPDRIAGLLAQALDMPRGSISTRLGSAAGFVWIKRKITPTESERVRAMVEQGRLPGISLQQEYGRSYPERTLASHLIGYVGVDNTGLDGIEWSFQRELAPGSIDEGVKEVFGNQVFLTIDVNVQYAAEQIAARAFQDNKADAVMILVMQADTGEVLAYVSLPSFDPNNYQQFDPSARLNRPTRFAYEPGSVFKIFSIASFLNLGGISEKDTFYAGGVYEDREHGTTIRDLAAYGTVDAQRILKYSSNVGAAYASETVSAKDFYAALRSLGFGKPTGVPLSGETAGILSPPAQWSARSKPTIAFGHEIAVSAMQIMAAATAIANDGLLLKPQLVSKVVSAQGAPIKEYGREPVAEVLSPQVARSVLSMLETATFDGGTARRARIDGIRISAKTGTAEVPDPTTGAYSEDTFIASFLGLFPTDDPQLVVYVVIDNPKLETYGSRIAAPVFKEIAERLIAMEGVPRSTTPVVTHPGVVGVRPAQPIAVADTMPDLRGMPKRSVLPLFKREDLNVVIRGEGFVVRQDPAPGTRVRPGMTLVLEFE